MGKADTNSDAGEPRPPQPDKLTKILIQPATEAVGKPAKPQENDAQTMDIVTVFEQPTSDPEGRPKKP